MINLSKEEQLKYGLLALGVGLALWSKKKEAEAKEELLPVATLPKEEEKLPETTSTSTKIPSPPPIQANTEYYKVVKGDNLTRIAEKFGTMVSKLLVLNPQIVNPDLIWENQVILVPTTITPPPAVTTTPPSTETDATARKQQCLNDINAEISNAIKGVYGISGVREMIYNKLVAKYPELADVIRKSVYGQLPDGWEAMYGLVTPTPAVTPTPIVTPTPVVTPTTPTVPTTTLPITYPRTVTVNVNTLYVRASPNTSAPLAGSQVLYYGNTFVVIGWVVGENVSGENRWWQSQKGNYVWCGGTLEKP